MFSKKITICLLGMITYFSANATPQECEKILRHLADRLHSIAMVDGNTDKMEQEFDQAAIDLETALDMRIEGNFYELYEDSFFYAAGKGNKKIFQLFLDVGFEVNHRNKEGKTPLMIAAFAANIGVVELLCELGSDIHVKDNQGWSAHDHIQLGFSHGSFSGIMRAMITGAYYGYNNPFEKCRAILESYGH